MYDTIQKWFRLLYESPSAKSLVEPFMGDRRSLVKGPGESPSNQRPKPGLDPTVALK